MLATKRCPGCGARVKTKANTKRPWCAACLEGASRARLVRGGGARHPALAPAEARKREERLARLERRAAAGLDLFGED